MTCERFSSQRRPEHRLGKDITKTRGFKRLMIFLLIGIVILGWFFLKINGVLGADIIVDSFEDYDIGILSGQGDWTTDAGQSGNVNADLSQHGIKSVYFSIIGKNKLLVSSSTTGTQTFWVRVKSEESLLLEVYFNEDADKMFGVQLTKGLCEANQYYSYGFNDGVRSGTCIFESWFPIVLEWRTIGNFQIRLNWNNDGFGAWHDTDMEQTQILYFRMGGIYSYFDNFSNFIPEMRIWGIDPVSGTEINNLDTEITIGYQGFDWDEYKGLTIAFWDERLHASSQSLIFVEDDLEPNGSGEIVVNLEDFGIDRLGKWYLTGLGFGSHLDIEGGMFLTTRGYIDFWTNELVSEEYYLYINVEGLSGFYPVSSFDTWYAVNVEEFDTPTTMASNTASLLQPILEVVGEFNDRAQNYFDTDEAYNKGFALGEIFPIISGYVSAIGYFMGSFPLVSWFKYIIILLFGIFLIKAVLKFIPFFGK